MRRIRKRRASWPVHRFLSAGRTTQLELAERRIDDSFRQIIRDLDGDALCDAWDRLDVLVSSFPALRLSCLDGHRRAAQMLTACFDLDRGPLPGFRDAMDRLFELCVTRKVLCALRSKLYTIAAYAATECPRLLPTIALAAFSLDEPDQRDNVFLEMVICASAVEWVASSGVGGVVDLDVSTWLAAQPSDVLLGAVGEQRAYYYAAIPGVLLFLDRENVLFGPDQLASCMRTLFHSHGRQSDRVLAALADQCYVASLRAEIQRVRRDLRARYSARSIADVEMLTHRALEALDELPPQANPLLQAIFVQSWVRYLEVG